MNKCNTCQYAEKYFFDTPSGRRFNLLCSAVKPGNRIIDVSLKNEDIVWAPLWCPVKDIKIENKMQVEPLTFYQKMELLKKIIPNVSWDDIQEHRVYHVPAYPNGERKDIYIVSKQTYYCSYVELPPIYKLNRLNLDKPSSFADIKYFYPSSLMASFLIEPQIKQHKLM